MATAKWWLICGSYCGFALCKAKGKYCSLSDSGKEVYIIVDFLATTSEVRNFVEVGVCAAADCPCDHEGCNQDECSLKT